MPATPVRESVLENMRTTLLTVKASTDYFCDVHDVRRTAPNPANIPNDLTLFVYSPSDATVQADSKGSATGMTDNEMLVHVIAIVSYEVASDTHANQVAHDIEKAICADRTRGGYAINTKPIGREIIGDESIEPWAFLTLRFQVRYRHEFANPSQQR